MKTLRKTFQTLPTLSALAALLWLAPLAAHGADFTYTINNGTITITGGCPDGALVIPDTIDGLPVTKIGYWAFWLCESMTGVTIPNSVSSIEERAFEHCHNLTSITIPNSVTSIGENTFAYCASVAAIDVDPRNPAYTSLDGVLFDKSLTTLIQYPGAKVGSYTVPNGVTSIGQDALSGCSSLTSVAIPNSVTSIGNSAFAYSSSLTNITIGDSLTSIGITAFFRCSMTTLTFPNSLTTIGEGAFAECSNLSAVYFEGDAPSVGADVFSGADNVTVYYLPGTTGWGATFAGRPALVMGDYTWHVYGGHLYALTRSTGTWIDHEAEAVSLGGHLVTINSEAENVWVGTTFDHVNAADYEGPYGLCIHIGYYYNDAHGAWEWISGQPVTYVNLSSLFPYGGTHAYIHEASHPSPFTWNAAPYITEPGAPQLTYGVIELEGDGRPIIATQPLSQVVWAGTTLDLYVQAVGSVPLAYQWRFDGTNLADATANTLTLANVQEANEGKYDVVVSNDFGSVTSRVAVLTVIDHGDIPQILTNGLVAYYPFNGDAKDASGHGNDGVLVGATFGPDRFGDPGKALSTTPPNYAQTRIEGINSIESSSEMTLSAWFYSETAISKYNSADDGGWEINVLSDGVWFFHHYPPHVVPFLISGGYDHQRWTHVLLTVSKGRSATKWYIDGVLSSESSQPIQLKITDPNDPVLFGYSKNGPDEFASAMIDDVRVYSRALSEAEVNVLYDYESHVELRVVPEAASVGEKAGSTSIIVQRLTDLDQPAEVSYGVTGGTATPGVDFVLDNGVLEFAAGVTEATIPLTIIDDRMAEGPETIVLGVTNLATGWATAVTLTIQDDDLFYYADFETGVGPEWSTTKTDVTPVGNRRFLGQFGNETVNLTFNSLPPHQEVTVSFDLFIILTWDGNWGDIWELRMRNGPTLLHTTFGNDNPGVESQAFPDTYPGGTNAPQTGAQETNTLGYFSWQFGRIYDAVYHLTYTFPHTDVSLGLQFSAMGLEDLSNESWGLDNVRIEVPLLPLFSEFSLNQLDVRVAGIGSTNDSCHLAGNFVLGQESDGVDLATEDTVITVGSKKITLPAGTLSQQGSAYRWQGNMEGAQMTVLFEDHGAGAFGFDIQAADLDLSGVLNPVVVQLLLGNDLGKATNRLAGELHLPQPPDTTPPQINVAGKPIVLWPPDGKYRRIQVSDFVLSVVDAEDKALSLNDAVITRVTSDEPDDANGSGDGNTVNDIVIGDTGQWVDLRAERQGRGNGRVYTIEVSATDASGNIGTASFEVQVPHDQGGRSVKDAVAATVTRVVGPESRTLARGGPSAIPAATVNPAPALGGELQLDGRGMFMRWQSTAGQAYRVEYKENLADPDWVPLGIDILGNGEVLGVRVPTTVYPQRFYRLRAVE